MIDILKLENEFIGIDIDLGRGADVLSLTHRAKGINVFFSTPWRERADEIRLGLRKPSTSDSSASWLEQYRGGWQTLCPNAGPARKISGSVVGFHGEASIVPWSLQRSDGQSAHIRTELFSIPISIDRKLILDRNVLRTVDVISNLSSVDLEFDYSSHPALGGEFLDGRCVIDTGARNVNIDLEDPGSFGSPGSSHGWPWVTGVDGKRIDMRQLPEAGESKAFFGWLEDFSEPWVSISNLDLGLLVRLDWDSQYLPYAWVWQELNNSDDFPWFKRARVIAFEPSSTQTSGPNRRSVIRLGATQSIEIPISITLEEFGKGAQ